VLYGYILVGGAVMFGTCPICGSKNVSYDPDYGCDECAEVE